MVSSLFDLLSMTVGSTQYGVIQFRSYFTNNWTDTIRILRHIYIRDAIASDAQAAMIYSYSDSKRKSFRCSISVCTSILHPKAKYCAASPCSGDAYVNVHTNWS